MTAPVSSEGKTLDTKPASPPAPAPPGAGPAPLKDPFVRVERLAGATRIDATLPGPVKAYAFPSSPAGRRGIALLVDTTSKPASPGGGSSLGAGPPADDRSAPAAGSDKDRKQAKNRRRARKEDAKEGSTRVTVRLGEGGGDVAIEPSTSPSGAAGISEAEQGSCALVWLDHRAEPSAQERSGTGIETVRRGLPGDIKALDAVDVDADGAEDIVLWRPGSLEALPAGPAAVSGAPVRLLVSDEEIQPTSSDARAVCDLECGSEARLWTTIVGSLRAYGPIDRGAAHTAAPREHEDRELSHAREDPSRWGIVAELPLPVNVSREGSSLSLTTAMVRSLPPAAGSSGRRILVGPESFGNERLRTLVIDPLLPADRNTTESWSLLPSPEKIIESVYLQIDGKDALVVTTRSAEKLGLFAEKRLRLFFLESDRTRRGLPPAFAMESRINLWQAANIVALDIDQDGRQDLVIGYWKGLKNNHMVLDAYLRNTDGTFGSSPRTTTFEVPGADRSFLSYGHDLDGDGAPELVLLAEGKLLVYSGTAGRKGKDLVAALPRWSFSLTSPGAIQVNMPQGQGDGDFDLDADDAPSAADVRTLAKPRFLDLDGDGKEEIFLAGPPSLEGGHFQVFTFPRN